MANYVNTNVYFAELNDAGVEKLKEILSRIREEVDDTGQRWFGDIFVDGNEGSPTYEDTEQIGFMNENVGAKWCYVEDIEDNGFRTVSAWNWPQEGLQWIFEKIAEVDPNMIGVATYEDESPMFIGASIYTENGLYDDFEEDYEGIVRIMKSRFEELEEHWNEEEECFDEEGNDIFYENLYEVVGELQADFVDECVSGIREARQEEDGLEEY